MKISVKKCLYIVLSITAAVQAADNVPVKGVAENMTGLIQQVKNNACAARELNAMIGTPLDPAVFLVDIGIKDLDSTCYWHNSGCDAFPSGWGKRGQEMPAVTYRFPRYLPYDWFKDADKGDTVKFIAFGRAVEVVCSGFSYKGLEIMRIERDGWALRKKAQQPDVQDAGAPAAE